MRNYQTIQPDYQPLSSEDNAKAQMSFKRMAAFLTILGIVWILCYNAQLQFPMRHILETYNRIGQNNISEQTYKDAIYLLTAKNNSDATFKHHQIMAKKYNFTKQEQQNICVLLIHDENQKKWMKTVESLLQQSYTNFKIYYFNNYKSGQEIYQFLQKNSLDRNKLKIIEDIDDTDYIKQFQYAKNYCDSDDIVIYMKDSDKLIGNSVFSIVNSVFGRKKNLQLLYSNSVVVQNLGKSKKPKYQIGKSYGYPQQIIKNDNFRHYPYLIDGLLTFKGSLLDLVDTGNLLSVQGSPYQQAGQVIFGINLLELSKQNLTYLPEILVLRQSSRSYVGSNSSLRKQIIQISQSKQQHKQQSQQDSQD